MKAPNHVVGGFVFVGLISSLLGWNIFSDPILLVTTVVSSLLPDIDHPKSVVGRIMKPLAQIINRNYGHRTITHSVFFLVGSTAVIGFINSALLHVPFLASTYFLGVFSHCLFDMMTLSGITFFYPINKSVFVLPGKESLRMRNDVRHELIVMIIFLMIGFSLLPLFQNGFWTTYNSSFSTLSHLHSEFLKADDMLYVSIDVKSGSLVESVAGYVILATANNVSIYDDQNDVLVKIPSEYQNVTSIDFSHVDNMSFSFGNSPDGSDISIVLDDDLFCNLNRLEI